MRNEIEVAFFADIPDALRDLDDQGGRLAFRLDGRIDHLLLDEFQDTSSDQWRVLGGLADRIVNQAQAPSTLFCVGDVKQAIYAWRLGTSEILDTLDTRFDIPAHAMNTSR